MTTKEYIKKLEREVKELDIRGMIEDRAEARAEIKKKRAARSLILDKLRNISEKKQANGTPVEYRAE